MSDDQFPREMLGGPGGRLHDRSLPGVPAEEAARAELQRRLETMTRVVLRPLASPLPLGFLALAAATLLTSGLQLGWLAPDQQRPVALGLLAFVFPLQLLTSILGYLSRDGVAGTGMGILAGTWLTTGLLQLTSPPGATSDGLGLFLLVAGVAMLVPATGAALGKLVPAMVLGTLLDQVMDVHHEPGVRRQL